jgi:hypothetical protein
MVVAAGCALLAIQSGLLAWSAYIHSPVSDEIAGLPAGISHWRFGRFELTRANPPLVRMIAALPVLAAGCETNWSQYDGAPGQRTEFVVGKDFLTANGFRSFWLFTLGRWACIPLVLLGGIVCWRWSHELYGPLAGLAALALWCFCPNILGNGALLTPDAGTTSLGVLAGYAFWKWLRAPDWSGAYFAGIALGLAELAKTNWLILFGLWPLLWIIWRLCSRHAPRAEPQSSRHTPCAVAPRPPLLREAAQLAAILALAILLINALYGFDGTFKRLGDFQFLSKTFRGGDVAREGPGFQLGNRFRHSWLAALPVPLPEQYVIGIDVQRYSVESGRPAYLFGVWKHGGWWYYYLAAATVKVPVGIWILLALAIAARLAGPRIRRDEGQRPKDESTTWRDELILLAPAIATLLFISSQTGINRHFRYALPIVPFLYIWLSSLVAVTKVAVSLRETKPKPSASEALLHRLKGTSPLTLLAAAAFAWSLASSLLIYPHSLSYFNELAGGLRGGPRFLLDTNTDWGQDIRLIKVWIDDHPQARPIYLVLPDGYLDPILAGIDAPRARLPGARGWYAISVNELYASKSRFWRFRTVRPIAIIGGSTLIYDASAERSSPDRFSTSDHGPERRGGK